MSKPTANATAGVQELINRLKNDGVEEGKHQADALLAAAKKQAAAIVAAAHAEADTITRDAQHQAERTEANGLRSLSLASRDASLHLKEQLQREFRGWIGGLVREQLDSPQFLADVIGQLASHAGAALGDGSQAPTAGVATILTPDGQTAAIDKFVKGQAAAMFRSGVTVQPNPAVSHGFRIQIRGKEVEVDFTDEAVTAAMMRFLAPKFRQLIGAGPSQPADA